MLIDNMRDTGLRLRDARRARGLSQQKLANAIGASRYWVIAMESGNEAAEMGLVLKAAQALGLVLDLRDAGGNEEPGVSQPIPNDTAPDLAAILDRARGPQR